LPIAVMWAFLPVVFAARVRRRAVRKRARAEYDAQDEAATQAQNDAMTHAGCAAGQGSQGEAALDAQVSGAPL
jgi:hypothetical protein